MQDVLGYEGRSVVVTGTASGMGEQTARILIDLGAKVTALDVKPTELPVETALEVDLRDRAAIDEAVASIEAPVDSVFSCAGLPGPPFSEIDTVIVNFIGARHLIESLVPKMPEGSSIGCISSAAAVGWEQNVAALLAFIEIDDFDEAVAHLEKNPEVIGFSGYMFSKQVIDAWVGWRGAELLPDKGIRLNCINPGPSDTAMMPAFHALAGKELVDTAIGPIGRYSQAVEQAWPLVMLNSPRMSYVSGEVLWTDGGFQGAMLTGRGTGWDDPSRNDPA